MLRRLIPSLEDVEVLAHYESALARLKEYNGHSEEKGPKPFMYDDLVEAVALIDRTTNGGCQRVAVLLLGWYGAFRRSELNQPMNECIQYAPKGMIAKLLFRTKTGTGHSVCI